MAFDLSSASPVENKSTGGFDISTATPVTNTGGGAALVTPKQRATPSSPETKKAVKSTSEEIGEYFFEPPGREEFSELAAALSGAGGAGLAAAGPKILEKTGWLFSKTPFLPVARRVGKGMETLGKALGTAPLATRALGGGVTGAAQSGLEQTAEMVGAPRVVSLPLSIGLTSAGPGAIKAVASLLPGRTGMLARGASKTIQELLSSKDELSNLPEQKRAFIEQQLNRIRGGEQSLEPQIQIMHGLKEEADKTLQQATEKSLQFEQQAQQILSEAQATTESLKVEKLQRINNIQSQFEQHAIKIKDAAEIRANLIEEQADIEAKIIEQKAQQLNTTEKSKAKQDAKDLLSRAREQIKKERKNTAVEIDRVRATIDKLRDTSKQKVSEASKKVSSIGQPIEATPFGQEARSLAKKRYDDLKLVRETNVKESKGNVDVEAVKKQTSGYDYRTSKAYQDFVAKSNEERLSEETGLVTNPEQLQREIDSIQTQLAGVSEKGKPPERMSFEGLERLRRIYRDESFGLPAERASAMGQGQSGRIAESIENIQREMVGNDLMDKYLNQYKQDSIPLKDFNTSIGQILIGKNIKDPDLFKRYAADIGPAIFKNSESVQQFSSIVGKENAETFARNFIATKLRDATPQQIKSFANSDVARDWLVNFPELNKELQSGVFSTELAEKIAKKRQSLSDVLKTSAIPNLIKSLASQEKGIVGVGAKEAKKSLYGGREAAEKQLTDSQAEALAVRKSGQLGAEKQLSDAEKTVAEQHKPIVGQVKDIESDYAGKSKDAMTLAEEQSGALTAQSKEIMDSANKKAKELLAGTTDESRLEKIFFGTNIQEWDALADIVRRDPKLQDAMSKAIGQLIASNPSMREVTFAQISERLTSRGLARVDEMNEIGNTLKEVMSIPVSVAQKSMFITNLIKRALGATGGAAAGQIPQVMEQ